MVAWPRGGGYRHQRRGVAGRGGRVGAAVGGPETRAVAESRASRSAAGGFGARNFGEPARGRIGISARSV